MLVDYSKDMLPACDLYQVHFSGRVFFPLHLIVIHGKLQVLEWTHVFSDCLASLLPERPLKATRLPGARQSSWCHLCFLLSMKQEKDSAGPSSASVSIVRLALLHRFTFINGLSGAQASRN